MQLRQPAMLTNFPPCLTALWLLCAQQPALPSGSEFTAATDTESGGSFTPGSTGSATPVRRRTRNDSSPRYCD